MQVFFRIFIKTFLNIQEKRDGSSTLGNTDATGAQGMARFATGVVSFRSMVAIDHGISSAGQAEAQKVCWRSLNIGTEKDFVSVKKCGWSFRKMSVYSQAEGGETAFRLRS